VTAYRRGAELERDVKRRLEAKGWFCVRSAGSKSPVDIVAVKPDARPLFVQVKGGKRGMTRAELLEFRDFCDEKNATGLLVERPPGKTRGQRWRFLNDELEQAA